MTRTTDGPADTTMMRIVHDALRRDLARAREALAADGTTAERRRALGAHLGWMMRFLDAHHTSEDEGLYALVRERAGGDRDALEVLDRMEREHATTTPRRVALETAAARLADDGSDDARQDALTALDALAEVLLPHLREEEDEAMPVVSRLVTAAEWDDIEHRYNLDPKATSALAFEGHWLMDGASDADRAVVAGLVPPVQRFFLLHAFARPYRRHAAACWGTATAAPRRVQPQATVAVTVDAHVDDVWDVVRDVRRVGEWSHECVGAAWLDGAREAVPGARFRGRNRAGRFRWGRRCEIVAADPYELVWITVPTAAYPDSTEWRIALEPLDDGTRITQSYRVLRGPKILSALYATLIPAHRDRTAALVADLERLGEVARPARATR